MHDARGDDVVNGPGVPAVPVTLTATAPKHVRAVCGLCGEPHDAVTVSSARGWAKRHTRSRHGMQARVMPVVPGHPA